MISMNRKQILSKVHRLVVKVGSALLTREVEGEGRFLDSIMFELLARQIDALMKMDKQVIIVSSGAVAAGNMQLGAKAAPRGIPEKQAWAAVGQPHLMHHYEQVFRPKGRTVAQVLLTHEDFEERNRYLNARHTFNVLLELGAVPIINENDTIAVEEIKVGDNDTLSAQVAVLVDADLLVMLTTVSGLMEKGKVIPTVRKIDRRIRAIAGGPGSELGIGGMITKLDAAKLAGMKGIPTIVASGRHPGVLNDIIAGEPVGTFFPSSGEKLSKRKHWIACAHKPRGVLVVDDGARTAVIKRGRSLLPKGIAQVKGKFQRGEAVSVVGPDGVEFARGLAAYSSEELEKIKGIHSRDIERMLGYRYDDEAIHRDDLTLMEVC